MANRDLRPVIHSRRKRKSSKSPVQRGRRWTSVTKGALLIACSLLAGAMLVFVFQIANFLAELPSTENLPLLLASPDGELLQPTKIFDRSQEIELLVLQNPNAALAKYRYLAELPEELVDAVLTVVDPDFWNHPGVRFLEPGAPATLAQRIAEELLLWDEPDSSYKKIRIEVLALQITMEFGREQLLEWYLNSAYFGQWAKGVDAAALVYFGKTAPELNLAEAALLAAIIQAPALNPIDAPEAAIERQGVVLQAMVASGHISLEEAIKANTTPISIRPVANNEEQLAPDFMELVLEELYEQIGKDRVLRGGLEIVTTLDVPLQKAAACAVETQLARLSSEIGLNEVATDCEAARLLPRLEQKAIDPLNKSNASVVLMQSQTGQILAAVGDLQDLQPPGTSITPFLYLTAISQGYTAASLLWDIPSNIPLGLQGSLPPGLEYHGPVSLRNALANDLLAPGLQLFEQIGASTALIRMEQSGLKNLQLPSGELAAKIFLDQGGVSLMEMSHAYSMLSNRGQLAGVDNSKSGQASPSPTTLMRVSTSNGRVILDHTTVLSQVIISEQIAFVVTDILSNRLSSDQSSLPMHLLDTGRPTAVQLATTINQNHSWVMGYTPSLVVGVLLSHEDSGGQIESTAAAGLWQAIMKSSLKDRAFENWQQPPGISEVTVCDPSGLLPTPDCPKLVKELFISGTEPLMPDNLYKKVAVNTQTNKLATIFSPEEFVVERVYLNVPAFALEWARSAGIDIAPLDYDVIFNTSNVSGPIAINYPEAFSYVSGKLSIRGTVNEENLDFYRVQIGEGLNPRQWLQIGEDGTFARDNELLTIWDTSGLNGLYAIQLMMVRKDQSIETSVLQVTVDNQAPTLSLLYPTDGQEFSIGELSLLTIQAQAEDNIGLAEVQILVDEKLISVLRTAPYIAVWEAEEGEHQIKVIATDYAGNSTVVLQVINIK